MIIKILALGLFGFVGIGLSWTQPYDPTQNNYMDFDEGFEIDIEVPPHYYDYYLKENVNLDKMFTHVGFDFSKPYPAGEYTRVIDGRVMGEEDIYQFWERGFYINKPEIVDGEGVDGTKALRISIAKDYDFCKPSQEDFAGCKALAPKVNTCKYSYLDENLKLCDNLVDSVQANCIEEYPSINSSYNYVDHIAIHDPVQGSELTHVEDVPHDIDFYFAFKFKIKDFSHAGNAGIISQFFELNSTGTGPSVFFNFWPENTLSTYPQIDLNYGSEDGYTRPAFNLDGYENKWVDIILGVKMDSDDSDGKDGYIKFWLNGSLVHEDHNILLAFPSTNPAVPPVVHSVKVGYYQPSAKGGAEIFFDDVRYGESYDEVVSIGKKDFECTGACLSATPLAPEENAELNTTGERWYVVSGPIDGWQASEMAGRTIQVNGVTVTAGQIPLPDPVNGNYYFHFSGGDHPWASWGYWTYPGSQSTFGGKTFELKFVHSSKCLDAFNTFPGANVGQWSCHGGGNQKWLFNHKGNEYYEVIDVRDNLCLEVYNGSSDPTANIQVDYCNGSNKQLFRPILASGTKYKLKNKNSGLVVDVEGTSQMNGANVLQYFANGQSNQELFFTEIEP